MKRLLMMIAVLAALTVNLSAATGTIQMNQGSFQNGSGGEFQALLLSGNFSLGGYVSGTTSNVGAGPSFQTFCIEDNEFIGAWGFTYDAATNPYPGGAVLGGVGGGNPDPVSKGTGWLYSMFARGILGGYFTGSRAAHAGELQHAIWGLEDEEAANVSNPFLAAAITFFGGLGNAKADDVGNTYGVYAVNLTNGAYQDGQGHNQDQLYYTTDVTVTRTPDVTSTSLVLVTGLCLLAVASRRFKKANS